MDIRMKMIKDFPNIAPYVLSEDLIKAFKEGTYPELSKFLQSPLTVNPYAIPELVQHSEEYAKRVLEDITGEPGDGFRKQYKQFVIEKTIVTWKSCAEFALSNNLMSKFSLLDSLITHESIALKLLKSEQLRTTKSLNKLARKWQTCAEILSNHENPEIRHTCADSWTEVAKLLINDRNSDIRYVVAGYSEYAGTLKNDHDMFVARNARRTLKEMNSINVPA